MTSKQKEQGQYMTPDGIVNMILDSVGYKGNKVLTKSIIEPSFGDGAFLIGIVQRIISEGKKSGLSNDKIANVIANKVYGVEKDTELYNKAIDRLNALLEVYDIPIVNWINLTNGDTLIEYKKYLNSKDYCVGNPPFVRIHNIPDEYRDMVKDFQFVNGMIDLYIIFYEIGIYMLNDKGKLGYISPNSFMKNTSQSDFRQFLIDNRYISAIYDFKTSKLFNDADTYTCICLLNKNNRRAKFTVDYKEYQMYDLVTENTFEYDYFITELANKAWNLSSEDDIKFLAENKMLPIKIDTIAVVQNGIATNKDAVYIIKAYDDKLLSKPYMGKHTDRKKTVYFENDGNIIAIESTILHRCVKASKYNGIMDNTYIIFPYKAQKIPKFFLSDDTPVENGYEPLTENELQKNFPKTYSYLLSVWDELSARDMDKNAAWFLFGRSQGLTNSSFKKVVFKHIINKTNPSVIPHILDNDVIVYSGMYTTIDINICISPKFKPNGDKDNSKYIFNDKDYDYELKEVSDILSSPEFGKYCSMVGKDMSGGYVGISTKMVKAFGTPLNTFPNFPVTIPKSDIAIADNNYMNILFHNEFIKCVNIAYENMGIAGKTSSKRVEPFHGYLAKVLQYKLGTSYDVYAAGYSYGKECNLGGNFDNKNVDVCVMKNNKPIGAIAFKLLSNNFKQNNKNYVEAMLGEAVQMRNQGLPYAFCYLIPEVALYLNGGNGIQTFDHLDKFTQNDLKVYYDIMVDESYKGRTPDVLFVGMHNLFDDTYITTLTKGDMIDLSSNEYLSAISPKWSSYGFIDDEDIRDYFISNNNIGVFLDNFIAKMLGV